MGQRIYLDNNASGQLDPRMIEFITQTLPTLNGNPSSAHSPGRSIRGMVAQARDAIATFLGVKPQQIIFTSGGTESINASIRGIALQKKTGHIITSAAEHSCVHSVCKYLESCGFTVTYLAPGAYGAVMPDQVRAAICADTCLIALMAVNNETGVKTHIQEIATLAKEKGIPLVVDAIAQLGKEKINISEGVAAMALSGHKIHALQGIGVLYVRPGLKLQPLLVGGEQEFGRRAGTENVLGILSIAKAIEILSAEQESSYLRTLHLREYFESTLMKALPHVLVNGEGPRTSNVSNLSFLGVDGEGLLMCLDREGISASHGSACSSGSLEPSKVLISMGLPIERVRSSIRFSLSRLTTEQEIDSACKIIISQVERLRRL